MLIRDLIFIYLYFVDDYLWHITPITSIFKLFTGVWTEIWYWKLLIFGDFKSCPTYEIIRNTNLPHVVIMISNVKCYVKCYVYDIRDGNIKTLM